MFLTLTLCVAFTLIFHMFNYLIFMMILELGEVLVIISLISAMSSLSSNPLFIFISILVVISFAICALTMLVSSFMNQGYFHFSLNVYANKFDKTKEK